MLINRLDQYQAYKVSKKKPKLKTTQIQNKHKFTLDLDECASVELNDCHPSAKCTNTWGVFECKCMAGLRDPWSDQRQKAGRECISCSNSYCNNRGTCQYDDSGIQLTCVCMNNFYGSQCEIDGDILAFSIGASIIAVLIITLTLVCLVMWGRRWSQEQKEMIGSPIFNYITRQNLDTHVKAMQSKTYQAQLEDRIRWAQIADVMSKSNHYAVRVKWSQLESISCKKNEKKTSHLLDVIRIYRWSQLHLREFNQRLYMCIKVFIDQIMLAI